MRTAFIDRRKRPFGQTPHQPDLIVADFAELAAILACRPSLASNAGSVRQRPMNSSVPLAGSIEGPAVLFGGRNYTVA
jgi:hypothetical protein